MAFERNFIVIDGGIMYFVDIVNSSNLEYGRYYNYNKRQKKYYSIYSHGKTPKHKEQ